MEKAAVRLGADERLDDVNERIRLIQKKNGLTFGTDAFLLSCYVRPKKYRRMAELGAGTGIASLLCAARERAEKITAIEIQPAFADLCARNVTLNGFDGVIETVTADVREVRAESLGGEFDLVIANPPYMRAGSGKTNEHTEKTIARHEVCGSIADFCAAAGRLLRYGGAFCVVYRADRLAELMCALTDAGLEPKRMTLLYPDTTARPRLVFVEAKRGAAPSLTVTPPIMIYRDGTRTYTDTFSEIYERGVFPF